MAKHGAEKVLALADDFILHGPTGKPPKHLRDLADELVAAPPVLFMATALLAARQQVKQDEYKAWITYVEECEDAARQLERERCAELCSQALARTRLGYYNAVDTLRYLLEDINAPAQPEGGNDEDRTVKS